MKVIVRESKGHNWHQSRMVELGTANAVTICGKRFSGDDTVAISVSSSEFTRLFPSIPKVLTDSRGRTTARQNRGPAE
jgi:hypothetical protein